MPRIRKREVIAPAEQRALAYLQNVEARFRTGVLNAIAAMRHDAGALGELTQLISQGRVEEALDRAANAGAIRIADQYAATYVAAGAAAADSLSDILEVTIGFDQVNERAVAHMQNQRLRLIREFTDEQRRASRQAMTDGITRGLNPVDQAREFRNSIGLTQRQQQSVSNYRGYLQRSADGDTTALNRVLRDRRFDPTIRRAVRTGEPLSPQQIDRMAQRYGERALKRRAETIARTEALRAVHVAQDEAIEQAIEGDHVKRGEIRRTWVAARDERTRESHVSLNGQIRGKNKPFSSFSGPIMHPGDPTAPPRETINCRCTLAIQVA